MQKQMLLLSFHFIITLLATTLTSVNSERVNCVTPVEYVLSHLNSWNIHHYVSLFNSAEDNFTSEVLANRNNFDNANFSLSLYKLDLNSFIENLYLNYNFLEKNVALVLPKTVGEAVDLFNRVSMAENSKNSSDRMRPIVFIHWPQPCNAEGCIPLQESNLFQNVPTIVDEIYFLQCQALADNVFWDVYSIYSIGRNNKNLFKKFQFDEIYNYYLIKYDFSGSELVSAYPSTVLSQELEYDDILGKATGGLGANVITYLEEALNFTIRFVKTNFFIKIINDTWSGMATQLIDGDIDVAVVKTTYLPERKGPFTFLVPHFTDGIQAFFQQPPASSIRNIFAEPFSKNLWGVLISVWFLVGFSTLLANKIKNVYDQRDDTDEEISKDTLLWAIAFTCQQGWHQDPQSISMKMIFLCGSVLGLIVYVAYSAALVSALSTEVVPIKNFDDLLYNQFAFAFEPGSQTIGAIINKGKDSGSDEIDSSDIAVLIKNLRKPETDVEGVGWVYSSKTAYLSFSDAFLAVAKDTHNKSDGDLCKEIASVRVSKVPFRSGMLMKKMSPLKEFFNVRLVQMYEEGLMRRYQYLYKQSFQGACDKQRHKKDIGLELADMFTAYCIILSGYALSFTVFIMEWLYFKKFNTNLQHTRPDLLDAVDLY